MDFLKKIKLLNPTWKSRILFTANVNAFLAGWVKG
jgi:hypothetical protein